MFGNVSLGWAFRKRRLSAVTLIALLMLGATGLRACSQPRQYSRSGPQVAGVIFFRAPIGKSSRGAFQLLRLPSGKTETLFATTGKKGTPGLVMGEDAALSPNGRYIAFAASHYGSIYDTIEWNNARLDLWLYDRVRRKAIRLTRDSGGYVELRWSPDSHYVAGLGLDGFLEPDWPHSEVGNPHPKLYVWDVPSGKRHFVANEAGLAEWSPSGRYLLTVGGNFQLFIWDARGKTARSVLSDVWTAFWLPGGSGFLLSRSARRGVWESSSLDGTPVCRYATGPDCVTSACWSPGRGWLAFNGQGDLYIASSAGQDAKLIAYSKNLSGQTEDVFYVWSPDGSALAISEGSPYDKKVEIYCPSDGSIRKLRNFGGLVTPVSWTKDGRYVVVLYRPLDPNSTANKPTQVLAISAKDGSVCQLATLPAGAEDISWRACASPGRQK